MDEKKILKSLGLIPIALFILAVVYTLLVEFVDVKPIGLLESNVGFASINEMVKSHLPFNNFFYQISKYTGYLAVLVCLGFAILGLIQAIKRKSIKKVDPYLYALALVYFITIVTYIFFEVIVINYRPYDISKGTQIVLEASYPSSHTMLAIVGFISASVVLKQYIKNKKLMLGISICLYSLTVIVVVSRMLSGVHWATDIFGGIIFSVSYITLFYFLKLIVDLKSLKK